MAEQRKTIEGIRAYQAAEAKLEAAAKGTLIAELQRIDLSDKANWDGIFAIADMLYQEYGEAARLLGEEWARLCLANSVDERNAYTGTADFDYRWTSGPMREQLELTLYEVRRGERTPASAINALSQNLGYYIARNNRNASLKVAAQINSDVWSNMAEGESYTPTFDSSLREAMNEESSRRTRSGGGGRRYKKKQIAYVRVPRPDCKCAYCLTMASRGSQLIDTIGNWGVEMDAFAFGYRSEQTALAGFHPNCRCTVVPLNTAQETIQGYEHLTDKWYEQYSKAYEFMKAHDVFYDTDDYDDELVKEYERRCEGLEHDTDFNRTLLAMRIMNEGYH